MWRKKLLALVGLSYVAIPRAEAQINWSALPSQDPFFGQMVAVLIPMYKFDYPSERSRRISGLYLLSGLPVVPTARPYSSDPHYFDTERPVTGLLTSFLYDRPPDAIPVEHVLVYAQRANHDSLTFRCELFVGREPRRTACRGFFAIGSGKIAMDLIDLLFDRTADDLRSRPRSECVDKLYDVDRARSECKSLNLVDNFRCSIASYLFARHECRTGAGDSDRRGGS